MVYRSGHVKQIIQQMVHQPFVGDLHATNKVFGGTKSWTKSSCCAVAGQSVS